MTAQSLLHELRGVGVDRVYLVWLVIHTSYTVTRFCSAHATSIVISKCTVHLWTTDCLLLPNALPTNALVIPHVDIYTYRTQTPGLTCRTSWTIDIL